ncbi:prepilin peptidase [Krasilnikoviella flava]|uniref:Leader peptidase (Prepilin peptidase) / N-methyltransferase n=1 Tax=Krasilnikoviella flava TaxID=526729 RepID=A0A1T5J7S4_9MICO|nr:A24 family peptidase [Krasilnikoviella flava]SKC47490.1 leader peptidase (prepilin peptidase) / N-methyltransferase [Krasilnikoviella flava]
MPPIVQRARDAVAPWRRTVAWVAAVAAVWAVWASGPGWSTPALVAVAAGGAALGVVDARTHRLPDALSYPTTAAVAALLLLAAAGSGAWDAALRALVGGLALGAAYLALHLVSPAGMGRGDVKLAVPLGMIGAWYGWSTLLAAAALPFLLGGIVSIVLIAARRATRTTALPFGPFMLLGTAIAVTAARLAA